MDFLFKLVIRNSFKQKKTRHTISVQNETDIPILHRFWSGSRVLSNELSIEFRKNPKVIFIYIDTWKDEDLRD